MDACRAAAERQSAMWVLAGCLAIAGGLAWLAAEVFAAAGADLERARQLGILSATTLAGYSKGEDIRAYGIAMAVGIAFSVLLWMAWCVLTRDGTDPGPAPPEPAAGARAHEPVLLAALLVFGLLRFDLAANGWDAPYTFYAEEGQAIAWADTVNRGGILSRDTYCLYGPLATLPVAVAFDWLGPSVRLWRICLYLLDIPALVAVFLLLRELGRHRLPAWIGVGLIAFHRMWPMPGMSWSLLRTGLGVGALAALAAFLRTGRKSMLLVCGSLVGAALMFSQEAGIAAASAVAAALGADHVMRRQTWREGAVRSLVAVGGVATVVLPVLGWYASHGAARAMLANLFGFAELRVLGHGGQAFPSIAGVLAAWIAHPGEASADALREALAAYFGPVTYALTVVLVAVRALGGVWNPRYATYLGLAVYGCALFISPLTRPDATHVFFAMPPALILAVDLGFRSVRIVFRRAAGVAERSAAAAFAALAVIGVASFPADTGENLRLFGRQALLNVTLRLQDPGPDDQRALELPRAGGVRVPVDRAAEIEGAVRYLLERTRSDEPVWAFPNEAMLNFLAERPPATRYPIATFAVTRDQRLGLIDEVSRSGARYAIVNSKPAIIDGLPSRLQMPEPWRYLDENFVLERAFGRLHVMRRAEP
jgi:hypothetical protein